MIVSVYDGFHQNDHVSPVSLYTFANVSKNIRDLVRIIGITRTVNGFHYGEENA